MDITLYAIPAILALVAKAVIYLYARYSPIRNLETRLYLFFLFSLSIQNIAEISVFSSFAKHYPEPTGGILYFGASIVAIALLLHLALVLSGRLAQYRNKYVAFIYLPTGILELLLWGTNSLVSGFEPVQYTYTKVPGPLYFLFEIYTIGYFIAVLALLVYGAKQQVSTHQKLKNKIMLYGLLPFIALVILIVGLQHFGMRLFNTTATLPIALTFFLAVTVYATHQYRLFDIAYLIPWSKVRARKTAFYDRIRAMIAEIADLGSVNEAVRRLSDTLGCSVALVSTGKPVLAVAGSAQQMVAFPLQQLHRVDRIVVANEIADSDPATYRLMQGHGVAAIVPFYPHSHSASGWMLLGDAFSEQVYTPLDFKMVEQLFDRMAELFLDKLLAMRNQLAAAERRLQTTELRLQQTEAGLVALRSEVESLRDQNLRLTREQAADSLIAVPSPEHGGALPSIVLLGRDKPLLKRLRGQFPQADQYVGPDSASFRRQDLPEVLICRLDADRASDETWLALLAGNRDRLAALLYGSGARDFITTHLDALAGSLVEILPDNAADEVIARRIQALAGLRRATRAIPDADCPLAGVSQPFQETMRDATRLAGFIEPVLIESGDARELVAVARFMHSLSGRPGEFRVLSAAEAVAQPALLADTLTACGDGTLLLTGIDTLAPEAREPLLTAAGKARLLLGHCSRRDSASSATASCVALPPPSLESSVPGVVGAINVNDTLRARFRSFALRLPTLRERRLDLPLLVHYFTLQYNQRAGTQAYLTQADVDDLMAVRYPADMDALRTEVFDQLNAKHRASAPAPAPEMELALADKTLDEHVAAFEAHLIEQTLERCQGNKSKAARLLGLRPNTLHYKLERYGLGGGSKDKTG